MHSPIPTALLSLLALAGGVSTSSATAQSTLTTTFADNNGGSAGWCNFFDLQINVPVVISQLDININGGTSGTVDFYTISGSYNGNTLNGGNGWTLMGTATVAASNGRGVPTPAVFNTPFVLLPGSIGVALHYQGIGMAYTNGNGNNQVYSTPEMTLTAGESVAGFFTGTQFTPRVWNGTIYYSPSSGGNFALSTPYGSGCPEAAASFYETFSGGNFDLGGTATSERTISLISTGTGFVVVPGGQTWLPPQNTLAVSTNGVTIVTLPTPFPIPGRNPVSSIGVSADGYLWLGSSSSGDSTPSVAELLTGSLPRFAPLWTDMSPTAGRVFFDSDPVTGTSYVTYDNVVSTSGTPNTFQVQLEASGTAHFVYRDIGSTGPILTGYSPGGTARDPGPKDLSAVLPIVTAPDRFPLTIRSSRPVEGQILTVTVTEVPAGSGFGALIVSPTQVLGGSPSPVPGMPGCSLYVGLDDVVYFAPTAGTTTINFPQVLPTGFAGMSFFAQGVVFAPGANAAGIISSNGLDLLLNPN